MLDASRKIFDALKIFYIKNIFFPETVIVSTVSKKHIENDDLKAIILDNEDDLPEDLHIFDFVISLKKVEKMQKHLLGFYYSEYPKYWDGFSMNKFYKRHNFIKMFDDISRTYDTATDTMSLFQDKRWKNMLIENVQISQKEKDVIIDLGCGSGDLSHMIQHRCDNIICIDICQSMLDIASQRIDKGTFVCADCKIITSYKADSILAGYIIRNTPDWKETIRDIKHSLNSNGKLHVLDMFKTPKCFYLMFIILKFWFILTDILLRHTRGAYSYIPHSVNNFVTANEFISYCECEGFQHVYTKEFMFGFVNIICLSIKKE